MLKNWLLFIPYLFCLSIQAPAQGSKLAETTTQGTRYKIFHAVNLIGQSPIPQAINKISLSQEDYEHLLENFSGKPNHRWTLQQDREYIKKLNELVEKSVSTSILLELPAQHPSVYIEILFDIEHDAQLQATTPAVTVQFITSTIQLDNAVLNLVKSAVFPDGFFTRNAPLAKKLALFAAACVVIKKSSTAVEKHKSENRLSQLRIDLLASLQKKFGAGGGGDGLGSSGISGFQASADTLRSIPSGADIVVISAPTYESFKKLEPHIRDDEYREQIKLLLMPISSLYKFYSYSSFATDRYTKEWLQRYGWEIIFINDTNYSVNPTDYITIKNTKGKSWPRSLTDVYSDYAWTLCSSPAFEENGRYHTGSRQLVHVNTISRQDSSHTPFKSQQSTKTIKGSKNVIEALTEVIQDSRKPFFRMAGVTVEDRQETASSKSKKSKENLRRAGRTSANRAAYRAFASKDRYYHYWNTPHAEFAAASSDNPVICDAVTQIKTELLPLLAIPAGDAVNHVLLFENIEEVGQAIDPRTSKHLVILGLSDSDLLEDTEVLKPILTKDKYVEQVKVLLVPWSIVYKCEDETLTALEEITAICSQYRWQVIFINDTDTEITSQNGYSSNIFSYGSNIQAWKLLKYCAPKPKKPIPYWSGLLGATQYESVEAFRSPEPSKIYSDRENRFLQKPSRSYYHACAMMITDTRKPYFKALNAEVSWRWSQISTSCNRETNPEAYAVLSNKESYQEYFLAKSHADFIQKRAEDARREEARRSGGSYGSSGSSRGTKRPCGRCLFCRFGFPNNCENPTYEPSGSTYGSGSGTGRTGGTGTGGGRRTSQKPTMLQCCNETDKKESEALTCEAHSSFVAKCSWQTEDCPNGWHDNSKYGCPTEGSGKKCSNKTSCPYAHNATNSYVNQPDKNDFDLLGVPDGERNLDTVKNKWRKKQKQLHGDHGNGDSDMFTKVNEAANRIIKWIDTQKAAPNENCFLFC